jgi:hypothetical protein
MECLFVLSVDTSGCVEVRHVGQPPNFVSPCYALCLLSVLSVRAMLPGGTVIVQLS